jgi:hypothetical protein
VILTPNTGANDFIKSGQSGEIVPIRDSEAIAEAILKWADVVMARHDPPARLIDAAIALIRNVRTRVHWPVANHRVARMTSPQTIRMKASSQSEVPLAAITGGLPLGGSSTFLMNLSKTLKRKGYVFPVVVLSPTTDYTPDFAAIKNPLVCLPHSKLIYEDRLRFGYDTLTSYRPRAVLSCMGTDSFEVLRWFLLA